MLKTYAEQKVENTLIYLAERIQPLSVQKVTILLCLADERAVRRTGAPILWLSYRAEINGPTLVRSLRWQLLKPPIRTFIDDEFSDCDIDILQDIVNDYGRYLDEELIEVLINEDTLWSRRRKTSGALIDFTELLDTDYKKAVFEMAYQSNVMESNLRTIHI
ncbi:type II toxin-antitoxin system antitoxin SocA domain-containing protein [Parapedobacter sp. DT-150]|uniref:type II toxin-antitoxin system antitoxin SocA domain-containing protein n=1 Tax=Parapedobacter sp. DT-150 TaxID=3396162 RepID=UPI003F1B610D